jgi:class 3 adenylate cyclase
MSAPETRHLTILLTDIKGFTDKTSHQTRADIQAMLDEHRAVVLPVLERGGGRLVKTIGDAFLMTFESPTNAVLAGASRCRRRWPSATRAAGRTTASRSASRSTRAR